MAGRGSGREAAMGRETWEVDYSRFLNFPPMEDATFVCPHLRIRRITKTSQEYGTWLTASSSAALNLIVDYYNADVIMRVQFRGRIMEEHFISKLNISWPHVSCQSGFPPRGTSVLTISYRDEMEQVQKFAFRFSTICNLEAFLNASKVYMEDARHTLHISCNNRSDVSSPQIYRPSMDFYSRTPLKSSSPQLPLSPNYENEAQRCDHSSRELASSSNFNKRKSTSEKFYQQSLVEVTRPYSCEKLQTLKSVRRKRKKGSEDCSPSTLKSWHLATTASTDAVSGHNKELYAKKKDKQKENPQSKMLISNEATAHIGNKVKESRNDQHEISKYLSKPIAWHMSSETLAKDNSHCRTPKVPNHETDEASITQNRVPSSSNIELEHYQQDQNASNHHEHEPPDAFPLCFSALLSSCFSSAEQDVYGGFQFPRYADEGRKGNQPIGICGCT